MQVNMCVCMGQGNIVSVGKPQSKTTSGVRRCIWDGNGTLGIQV